MITATPASIMAGSWACVAGCVPGSSAGDEFCGAMILGRTGRDHAFILQRISSCKDRTGESKKHVWNLQSGGN